MPFASPLANPQAFALTVKVGRIINHMAGIMRKTLALLAVVACLGMAGCGPIHRGPQIDHAKLNRLEEGKTTKAEVLAMFGNMPSTQTRDSSGMTTLTWIHTRSDYNWLIGVYLPAAVDTVTVVFDKNDIVQRYSFGGYQSTQEVWHEPSGRSGKAPDVGVEQQTFPQQGSGEL